MPIDIAVDWSCFETSKMRQNADCLKGCCEDRPTAIRLEGKPEKRAEKCSIDRSNAKLHAGKHSDLQQRCDERCTQKHGTALAFRTSTPSKSGSERGQKQCQEGNLRQMHTLTFAIYAARLSATIAKPDWAW